MVHHFLVTKMLIWLRQFHNYYDSL